MLRFAPRLGGALLRFLLLALPGAPLLAAAVAAPAPARAQPATVVDLDRRWDVRLNGTDDRDEFGVSLASGDWNGDGIDDLAIGAWLGDSYGNDRKNAGEVYVYFGAKVSHRLDGTGLDRVALMYGSRRGERSGTSVVSGDWDGDGVLDVAIGARFAGLASDSLARQGGRVSIVYGGAPAESAREIVDLNATADLIILGRDEDDRLGRELLLADLDGDGFDDLLVSAVDGDGRKNRRRDAGEVCCIWGRRWDDEPRTLDMIDFSDWLIEGVDENDGMGRNLAAGDLDGDGSLDLVITATFADGAENAKTNAGETYILFGGTRQELMERTDLARHSDCVLYGADSYENSGIGLAIGDFDGDGMDDLAVGADYADHDRLNSDRCGAIYLMQGRERTEWKRRYHLGQEADRVLWGSVEGEQIGRRLLALQWGADARDDLAIGANLATAGSPPRERAGKVFVLTGGPDFFGQAPSGVLLQEVADRIIEGAGAKDQAGYALGRIAFGAGRNERLLVGAPFADGPRDERPDGGEIYILPSDLPSEPTIHTD